MATTLPEVPVAKRVRAARKRAGYTLDGLAARIGTTRQVIINWENGKHLPNEHSRERLSEATGVPAETFKDERERSDDDEEAEVASDLLDAVLAAVHLRVERQAEGVA